MAQNTNFTPPPPPRGLRLDWSAVPEAVRAAVEQWAGSPVLSAVSQPTGFSPGVAARLTLANGRQIFVKAAGREPNPDAPMAHRQEASVVAALPAGAPVPRLLWSYDDDESGWIVLVIEDIEGQHPAQPWREDELNRVLAALVELNNTLTPSPLPPGIVDGASDELNRRLNGWRRLRDEASQLDQLDSWSVRHLDALAELEARAVEAVAGDTLLHFDIRADNLLLTPERVWFVDWPWACIGAAWLDVVFFASSVTMQGGPPPEQVIASHPAVKKADAAAITAAVISIAGLFTHRALQPPPPGVPVRAFQAAQGVVARQWAAERTGWR